jgi:hypothetical protein
MNREHPPAGWRELSAVAALTALCDIALYRGHGFAGCAALFALAPMFLLVGAPQVRGRWSVMAVGVMLAMLAVRLVWCGSVLQGALGFALLVAFAMSLAGMRPNVLETAMFGAQSLAAGFGGLRQYVRLVGSHGPSVGRGAWTVWAGLALPAIAVLVFGAIFVLANPDLHTSVQRAIQRFVDHFHEYVSAYAPAPSEVIFWAAVAWITAGLLRPLTWTAQLMETGEELETGDDVLQKPFRASLYTAFRNMLATVIVLFAVYLVFEFQTLWLRTFPKGFYYSGYAHQGAAWLTFALALATAVLSLVFRGSVLDDPRLPWLRRLAWLWSLENLLLAVAVYHRLFIYIGFNGMTRMRTVGLFGISAVVAGFLIVLWKLARNRDFLWLLRRHLGALALAVYLFALTPVDALVHHYNVRRILAGDPAPSVQISVHPIDSQGILQLPPLLKCSDPIIREGVAALLAERLEKLKALDRRRQRQGWTAYQIADTLALRRLENHQATWKEFDEAERRTTALARFHKYAYQWY